MELVASTLLAIMIMFGVPGSIAWYIQSDANRRRLDRARRYRARHGTPWWVWETDSAQRQRKWIERERDRVDGMS